MPLRQLHSQKGGWEGWAQVELAVRIPTWLGGQCLREESQVYNNGTRADIVHYSLQNTSNVIELRCQSMLQDEINIGSLANRINDDITKIALGNRNLAQNLPNTRWYVIGIRVDSNITGGAVAHAKQFNFGRATNWTQANQFSPTIFWCTY